MAGRRIGEAFIRVRPDTAGFGSAMKQQGRPLGRDLAVGMGAGFGAALLAGPITAAISGLGRLLRGAFDEAREAAQLGRLTAAVIKSTGGAAGVTAPQVANLAERLSNLAAVDDEVIQGGANILLTFTKVRNTVGRGNAIFDQAAEAALNMTAALNGGNVTAEKLRGVSLQVGKALNDPTKGMLALRRAGVSFTEAQQKQIKEMQKSGNLIGAQKIILAELKKEFGGAAAAAADPAQRATVAWANFKEMLGEFIMPLVGRLGDFLTSTLIPGLRAMVAAFNGEGITSDGLVGFLELVGVKAREIWTLFQQRVLPVLKMIAEAGRRAFGWVTGASKGAEFVRTLIPVLLGVIAAIKVWTAVQAILNVVLTANPIGLIIVAIAALIAGIIYAYKHSETFRRIVQGAWAGIKIVVSAVVSWIVNTAVPFLIKGWNLIVAGVKFVIAMFKFYWNLAVAIVRTVVAWITERWRIGVANIKAIIARVAAIIAIFRNAFEQARNAVATRIAATIALVRAIPGRIRSAIGDLGRLLYDAGASIVRGLWEGIQSLGGWLADKVKGLIERAVPGPVKRLLGIASPSKLFARFGRDTIRGYWLGLRSEAARSSGAIGRTLPLPGVPAAAGPGAAGINLDGLARVLARAVAAALEGATLTINDRTGRLADLYERAG